MNHLADDYWRGQSFFFLTKALWEAPAVKELY